MSVECNTFHEIDLNRAENETVMPKARGNDFLKDKLFGAYRYANYIENYSDYTYKQFCKNCTDDDLVEMELLYRGDWEYRKYSDISKKTIPNGVLNNLKEQHWKIIIRKDISDFYEFAKSKKLFAKNSNIEV